MRRSAIFRLGLRVLLFAAVARFPLRAQQAPLSLCLVQTRADAEPEYDPPAGPWAIALYQSLSGRKLRDGASLAVTVLPALTEKDVPQEVHRLQCPWVIQLRFHGSFWPGGRYVGDDEDSILFYLWNGATGKSVAQGAALIEPIPGEGRFHSHASIRAASAGLARQIVKKLNKLP